jgi:DNA-binding transcriptional ArsR family regulator
MARAPTTLDSFSAIAEPKRRRVLEVLAGGELPVNDIVLTLHWPQPQVSKHLGVLRQVGLVSARREGRQQMYAINPGELKPIHDWAGTFERLWSRHLQSIKAAAEAKARHASPKKPSTERRDSHG